MVKVILPCILLALFLPVFSQKKDKKGVAWQTVEAVLKLAASEKRPILIDVYTDWCMYCKVMDNTIWNQQKVSNYLKDNFYAIKFNAESKEAVDWMGQTFEYKSTYKVHMLAAQWLGGNMVYPSTVIVPVSGEPIIVPGVINKKEIEPILVYFGEKHNLKTDWKTFKENYKSTW